jgi:hypothetical protein
MTTIFIIMTSGIFALAAVVGLIDLFVHLVCWSARSLRTPTALKEQRDTAIQRPAQGMAA